MLITYNNNINNNNSAIIVILSLGATYGLMPYKILGYSSKNVYYISFLLFRLLSEIKEEPCEEESKVEITSDPEVRQSNIDGNGVRNNTNTYSLSGVHKTKHTQKTIPCHICHKILIYRRRHEHIRRHLDDRTFECSNCGKKFSEKSDLKKHFLIHSNVKAHKCDICGKSFIRKGHLKRHMTVHTGEKQFSCDICGMSYTQRHNLTKHRRNHEQF